MLAENIWCNLIKWIRFIKNSDESGIKDPIKITNFHLKYALWEKANKWMTMKRPNVGYPEHWYYSFNEFELMILEFVLSNCQSFCVLHAIHISYNEYIHVVVV